MSSPEPRQIAYDPPLIVPWSVIGALVVSFILLGLATRGPNTLGFDQAITDWVQQWQGPAGAGIAAIGNFLGEQVFGLTLLALAWVGFAALRRRRELWFTLILAIGRLFATQLKDVFDSPRPSPSQATLVEAFDHWGFPSGHVTTATISLGAIAWTIARLVPRIDLRLVGLVWATGVGMTMWARIWVGAHWFTDTVGGVLVGLVLVALASNLSFGLTRADRAIARRQPPAQTTPPSPPATG